MSLQKISLHVHHACNSLFETVDYQTVRKEVCKFLVRNSRRKDSLLEHMEARGMYRLNPNSASAMQLALQFTDETPSTEAETKKEEDFSLSLF